MRAVLGVIVGFVVAAVSVQVAEMISHRLYPFPPGTDMHDMEAIKNFVSTLPLTALLLVLGGWLFGTLIGTFVAAKIGRSRVPAYILGVILLCAGIGNSFVIPQPVWFTLASVVIFVAGTFAGIAMAKPPQPAAAA